MTERPSAPAISRGPHPVRRRSAQIRSCSIAETLRGLDRGHDDLRRRATREHLGHGLRPQIAGQGDLVRMLEALGREDDQARVDTMRRVVELDRVVGLER